MVQLEITATVEKVNFQDRRPAVSYWYGNTIQTVLFSGFFVQDISIRVNGRVLSNTYLTNHKML